MADFWTNITDIFKGVKLRSNVLTHLAWLAYPIIIPSFYGLLTSTDLFVRIFCALVIFIFLLYNFAKYNYWAKKDPDRLHSEKTFLDLKKLRLTRTQGEPAKELELSEMTEPPSMLNM